MIKQLIHPCIIVTECSVYMSLTHICVVNKPTEIIISMTFSQELSTIHSSVLLLRYDNYGVVELKKTFSNMKIAT